MASAAPSLNTPDRALSRWAAMLFFGTCGYPIGVLQMSTFLIPLRARDLGASLEMVGIIVGAGSLLGMVLAVPAGALADRIGAKHSFIIGALINGVAFAIFAATDSYWVMLVLQVIRGIPHSMAWVASQTYASAMSTPDTRVHVMGRFSFMTNISSLISPILVGAVAEVVGVQPAFLFLLVVSVIHLLAWLPLPDARMQGRASGGGQGAGYGVALQLMKLRPAQIAILLTFIRLWLSSAYGAFFPLLLKEHGFGTAVIGTIMSGNGIISAVTGLWSDRLARRSSNEVATAISLGIGTLGLALCPYLIFMPLVYAPSGLVGVGMGLSMPLVLAILSEEVPPGQRGVAMGMRTTANQGGALIAPPIMGFLFGVAGTGGGFLLGAIICWAMIGGAVYLHLTDPARKARAGVGVH
ncbi:MAG: MFS transporter [Chloroflexota bacterium]